ncbi:unnamed protein product [Enterobius vermicularis]|uniref:MMS1_N domain-containing protein n=1 Tax=Enterobius vermicularis TaxID=51028 RepID=A0A0N4VJA6_ENTVE|nr:unnamed protein product [Enterobius vermicularis]
MSSGAAADQGDQHLDLHVVPYRSHLAKKAYMPSILLDGERAVLADRSGALLMKLRTVGLLQIMLKVVDCEKLKEVFSVCGFCRPSALAIIEEGRTLGLVDDRHIIIGDTRSLEFSSISEEYHGCRRGLAVSECGNFLINLHKTRGSLAEVLVYDIRQPGEAFDILAYALPLSTHSSKPCFIDYMRGRLVISDLGVECQASFIIFYQNASCIRRFDYWERDESVKEVYVLSCKIGNPRLDETTELKFRDFLSNGSVGFNYPAGVVFDSQYDIVLSDAGASKLYVLFSHLIFLYYFHINDSDLWFNSGQDLQGEISTSDGFCYGSGICVNRCGVLAVCDRRLSEVKFYRLVAAG